MRPWRSAIVATRRNDRTLRTDRGEPVRNRDLWTVHDVGWDGSLTVPHLDGHGHVTLPADYMRAHVRLGYAATSHGYEGDTVDLSLGVVTPSTSHRGLYVAATRGRRDNQLLVVADDRDDARDVLEQVLTHDRADVPAIVQRQHLAAQVPGGRPRPTGPPTADEALTAAKRALDSARERAAPHLVRSPPPRPTCVLPRPSCELTGPRSPTHRSGGAAGSANMSSTRLSRWRPRDHRDLAERLAAPFITEIQAPTAGLRQAEQAASIARLRDCLDRLALAPATRVVPSPGIDPPGL